MHLPSEVLDSISLSLRVFDRTAKRLPKEHIDIILTEIRDAQQFTHTNVMFTMAVQAAVYSGYSRDVSLAILDRLTTTARTPLNEAEMDLFAKSLDVALFEAYREAESLRFDQVFDFSSIETSVNSLLLRLNANPNAVEMMTVGEFRSAAQLTKSLLVPLLNSEHQTEVAGLICAFLECLKAIGLKHMGRTSLLHILRRCIQPPRLAYDLNALKSLRDSARSVSAMQVSLSPTFAAGETDNERLTAFKFLVLSDDIERQIKIFSFYSELSVQSPTERKSDFIADCITWISENSTSPPLLSLAVEVFFKISVVPNSMRFLSLCTRFGDEVRGKQWLHAVSKKPATLMRRYVEAQFLRSVGESGECLKVSAKPLSVYSQAFSKNPVDETSDPDFKKVTHHLSNVDASLLYGCAGLARGALSGRCQQIFCTV